MTDKQSFLDKLTAALYERNISDTDIRPYIERFDRFYDRMVSESPQTQGALEDIEAIADNIAAQVSDRYDEINRLAERTMTVDTVRAQDTEPEIDAEPTVTTDITEIAGMADEYEPAELVSDEALIPAEELASLDMQDAVEFTDEPTRLPDYTAEEPVQNSKMFWILFGISLPITLPLFVFIVGAFAAVWVGLAAVVVVAVAALVALVAGGAAVSLVGIVYGIIQLFTSVPVGLYEIGLGVIVAGAVMFAGILVYNFAVRLVPLLMRLLWKLFLFVLKQLKYLFNFLRKECVKL
ncbi:MAG: hypothetical protein IJ428_04910 [Clostridia bacterium]|nr:hypothetical protein [Clostridia bacterium]